MCQPIATTVVNCCCVVLLPTAVVSSVQEARDLYDQLATVAPLLLALSASAPIYRGYMADIDARWDVIAGSVDCRTRQERGLEPLSSERMVISKSRYDSISSYLSTSKLGLSGITAVQLAVRRGLVAVCYDGF